MKRGPLVWTIDLLLGITGTLSGETEGCVMWLGVEETLHHLKKSPNSAPVRGDGVVAFLLYLLLGKDLFIPSP